MAPEQFGARGDGVTDDAPAIQRAIDAVAAQPAGGLVVLQPSVAYRCRSGLVLDASRVSLWGSALLDFAGSTGACLTITASSVAREGPANNYGCKGLVSGCIHVRGAGSRSASVGIHFDSNTVATSAQLLIENVAISECRIGVSFGRHAYNSLLAHCEIFNCATCIEWLTFTDNGERNTLLGCTLFNSDTAVRMSNSSAALYLISCSLDYTHMLYDVTGGTIFATDCHHESSIWMDGPIRCHGDGAVVQVNGGWFLNQAEHWEADHVIDVGAGASVVFEGVFLHNVAPGHQHADEATAWATGAGALHLSGCHGFELGRVPMRLHASRTCLADPDFLAADWQDPVWRLADTRMPITDRHGVVGDNLRLTRTHGTLTAAKTYGATSPASFVLFALAVRGGDQILAGFQVRRDPGRPDRDGTVLADPTWARIDAWAAGDLPVITRSDRIATLSLVPASDRFQSVAPLASRAKRIAPDWATHLLMIVDLVQADQATFQFRGLWCDRV